MKINNTALINEKLILFYIIISLFFLFNAKESYNIFFSFLTKFLK